MEMDTCNESLVRCAAASADPDDAGGLPVGRMPATAACPRPAVGDVRQVRVNGIELNVLVAGHGPDVLLVHGFPDSHQVWRYQIPMLVEAGYRVIAPDTRGCGDSQISPKVADYRVENLVADLVALLDVLGVARVKLVAHDWGAATGWQLAMQHPERVERFVALSVGHPAAYAGFDPVQRLRGWYTLFFQLRGVAEYICCWRNWSVFRRLIGYDAEFPHWRERLSRPGRLTAGLNYYRANIRLLAAHWHPHAVIVPVHGFWSSRDKFLTEKQMLGSQRYVRAPWAYTRMDGPNHWLQLDAPERFNPLLLDSLR